MGRRYNNGMRVKFTKMHGLGNDFVVLDAINQSIQLTPEQISAIANRHFGVGCDQLLLVELPTLPDADFRYRIFNADGGEVAQCVKGARCFVRFVHDTGLARSKEIRVHTAGGMIFPRLEENGLVTVNMGAPRFDPPQIPFVAPARAVTHSLDIGNVTVEIGVVSMGNPHAVQVVPNVDAAPVVEQGEVIERHPRFPQRVNAGFMQIMGRHAIRLRVFERGAGETLACGTGACAAVVSGIQRRLLDSPVKVETRGGELNIAWQGEGHPVMMTGPAVVVFEGEMNI